MGGKPLDAVSVERDCSIEGDDVADLLAAEATHGLEGAKGHACTVDEARQTPTGVLDWGIEGEPRGGNVQQVLAHELRRLLLEAVERRLGQTECEGCVGQRHVVSEAKARERRRRDVEGLRQAPQPTMKADEGTCGESGLLPARESAGVFVDETGDLGDRETATLPEQSEPVAIDRGEGVSSADLGSCRGQELVVVPAAPRRRSEPTRERSRRDSRVPRKRNEPLASHKLLQLLMSQGPW